MSDGKIYITITDERKGEQRPDSPITTQNNGEKEKKSLLGDYAKHQFFNLLESQAKQAVNFSISNIGNFTGNYQRQREVQTSISILNSIKSVGLSAFAGAKYTGSPYGALIGAAISISSQTINLVKQDYMNDLQNSRTNYTIEQLRNRSGLNQLNNGSRGTNN